MSQRNDLTRERAEIIAPLLALHPKTENPTHGCCAPPKLCDGHAAECRSSEHAIGGGTPWPCRTLRAVGITCDADAEAIRRLADGCHEALAQVPGGDA